MNVCLIRYSEIALKGDNIRYFENLLLKNTREFLIKNKIKFSKIKKINKRILIYTNDGCGFLKRVFGVASFSHAIEVDLDMDEIKKNVFGLVRKLKFGKFRISARRANKKFKHNSLQINIAVGDLIKNKLDKKVDLKNFDLDVGVEILDKAYVFIDKIKGPGGLPLGVEGRGVLLVENKNSLLAGYLVMKRGCKIIPVGYKKLDIGVLKKFDYGLKLRIAKNIKEIEKIAKEKDAKALVLGHTLKDFKEINTNLVVLRPLVGLEEKEIKTTINRKIINK